jgi:hypothetical protein
LAPVALIMSTLPVCDDSLDGQPCIYPAGDKGAILYSHYKPCAHEKLLIPGFSLLPNWLLAGACQLAGLRAWIVSLITVAVGGGLAGQHLATGTTDHLMPLCLDQGFVRAFVKLDKRRQVWRS